MNINDLEKEINFILNWHEWINPYLHYAIEVYSNDYNYIFALWEDNKNNSNLKQQLVKKILVLEQLVKNENNFIKMISQLTIKFNQQKINSKINKIIKIITIGCYNFNQKITAKLIILNKIKEIKQQNLVKINELNWRIKEQKVNSNINLSNSTNMNIPAKITLS